MERLEAGLKAAETVQDKIIALNALAWHLRLTEPLRALPLGAEAVRLAREAGDAPGLASGLCRLGACAGLLFRHQEAREALEEGLALSRRVGDRRSEAWCLLYLGRGGYLLADYADAALRVMAAIPLHEQTQDWEGLGACFTLLGSIQLNLCDYGQALDWYLRGLETRERAGDPAGIVKSLNNIGIVHAKMGDYAQALAFHRRCLDQARSSGARKPEANILSNLGDDCIGLGRYEEALEVSRRAVELGESLEEWGPVTNALGSMGDAYIKTGRQAEALGCYTRALEIARSLGNKDLAADFLCRTGVALGERGELEAARARLAEAAALALSVGARETAFRAAEGLSEVCKRLGDYAAALGHHETFRRLEKEVFSEEADRRTKSLIIRMEVEHHRREAAALAEANAALRASNEALSEANARLRSLATTDPLTGLANHRALAAALDAETARCRREGGSCALLFLDIDFFKRVNDTYGHPVGDAVLCEFAGTVRACLREVDTLGRWGGEEFLALLPGTDEAGAHRVAERVRAAVAAHPLVAGQGLDTGGLHLTCSVGVAACPPQPAARAALVEAADRALYAAKRLGRNQVRLSGTPAPQSAAPAPQPVSRHASPYPERPASCG